MNHNILYLYNILEFLLLGIFIFMMEVNRYRKTVFKI